MTAGPFRYPDRAANADAVALDKGGEFEAKGVMAQHAHTRRELGNIGAFAPERDGNQVVPFTTGEAYFDNVCGAISAASTSVFILGWQVNWAVLLKPGTRLIDALKSASDNGARIYVMPWLSPKAGLDTGDFSTMLAVFQLNAGKAQPTSFCCPAGLQSDYEGVEEAFFSHHQKLVVIDNRIAYVGGIDLAFGRRDDNNFSLDHGWRKGPEIYNTGIPPLRKVLPTEESAYVDELELLLSTVEQGLRHDILQAGTRYENALMRSPLGRAADVTVEWWRTPWQLPPKLAAAKAWVSGGIDNATEGMRRRMDRVNQAAADKTVEALDRGMLSESNITAAIGAARDVVRTAYRALLQTSWKNKKRDEEVMKPGVQSAPAGGATLRADQPRLPWHDVQVRIEGPSVYDLSMNFIRRWNSVQASYLPIGLRAHTLIGAALMPQEPAKGKGNGGEGGVRIDVLRSASIQLQTDEYKATPGLPRPVRRQDEIHDAMVAAIRDAEQFIYIENQFFQSAFGEPSIDPNDKAALSGPMRYMMAMPGNRVTAAMSRAGAAHKDQGPRNHVSRAIADRIEDAIRWGENFHAYIVLPVHPEGSLADIAVVGQVHWTMQSLVFGTESLVNRVRLAIYAKKHCKDARDGGQWEEAKRKGVEAGLGEDGKVRPIFLAGTSPNEVLEYLTVLNLRSCQVVDGRVLTEQAYVHSKLLIVDDRIVIVGSANINDRSLDGGRDSELAVAVTDLNPVTANLDGSNPTRVRARAQQLRIALWRKHFALSGHTNAIAPASELASFLSEPAGRATWRAVQAVADANATAYAQSFGWAPSGRASIWPVWKVPKPPMRSTPFDTRKSGDPIAQKMPFSEDFWGRTYRADLPVGLKGFICSAPLEWTYAENNHPGLNQILLTDVRPSEHPASSDIGSMRASLDAEPRG